MPYSCDVCGDEFDDRMARAQHKDDTCHWQCNECEATFCSKAALKSHCNAKGH
jgi:predicted sulfurtransferase